MKKYLVDTSVWIDHFRKRNLQLCELLIEDRVVIHELVLLELAVGPLQKRTSAIKDLKILPFISAISFEEALYFLERYKLFNIGIGAIDLCLLASAKGADVDILTLDKNLFRAWSKVR